MDYFKQDNSLTHARLWFGEKSQVCGAQWTADQHGCHHKVRASSRPLLKHICFLLIFAVMFHLELHNEAEVSLTSPLMVPLHNSFSKDKRLLWLIYMQNTALLKSSTSKATQGQFMLDLIPQRISPLIKQSDCVDLRPKNLLSKFQRN